MGSSFGFHKTESYHTVSLLLLFHYMQFQSAELKSEQDIVISLPIVTYCNGGNHFKIITEHNTIRNVIYF